VGRVADRLGGGGSARRLDAYVQMYLKEEIQAEAVTRNLPASRDSSDRGAFPRPDSQRVDACAGRGHRPDHGPGYLEILEDTLFTFRVPATTARASPGSTQ